jgi:hypothetical protein
MNTQSAATKQDIRALEHKIDLAVARLESKLDSKPNLTAMWTGIVVVWFVMASAIASTVAILHTLGFIKTQL